MKNTRSITIPSRKPSSTTNDVGGKAFGIRYYPSSRQGKPGPFTKPANPPPPATQANDTFRQWVDYLVEFVGAKLEKLNALQFNLDKNNEVANAKSMSDELGELADALQFGRVENGKAVNPTMLNWPLAGLYTVELDAKATGCASFVVDLYFENEPEYRMVVNCSIEIDATGVGETATAPNSSSSSYIATSSSG